MKPATALIFLLLLSLVTISCKKKAKTTLTGDYLVIGHDGGFVNTNAPYYVITGSGLAEDTTHYPYGQVPANNSGFNFNYNLPTARYDTVKGLLNSIPSELLGRNNTDIGTACPDFGYEDVRASINGVLYQWKFECNQSASSAEVQAFINRINADF